MLVTSALSITTYPTGPSHAIKTQRTNLCTSAVEQAHRLVCFSDLPRIVTFTYCGQRDTKCLSGLRPLITLRLFLPYSGYETGFSGGACLTFKITLLTVQVTIMFYINARSR